MQIEKFRPGDAVRVYRDWEEGRGKKNELMLGRRPSEGSVVQAYGRFVCVELRDGSGQRLYRESFWPEEVTYAACEEV